MNDKTSGSRGARRTGALAAMAAVAMMTAACGAVHVHVGSASSGGSASTGSATYRAALAYAHCMQTHGVPNFPDPGPSQGFSISGSDNGSSNDSTPLGRANNTCQHFLPSGSMNTGSGVTQSQLNLALKVVQCLRTNGEPNFPDPTVASGSLHFTVQPDVLQSAQFQTALKACKSLIPKGVNFP